MTEYPLEGFNPIFAVPKDSQPLTIKVPIYPQTRRLYPADVARSETTDVMIVELEIDTDVLFLVYVYWENDVTDPRYDLYRFARWEFE